MGKEQLIRSQAGIFILNELSMSQAEVGSSITVFIQFRPSIRVYFKITRAKINYHWTKANNLDINYH